MRNRLRLHGTPSVAAGLAAVSLLAATCGCGGGTPEDPAPERTPPREQAPEAGDAWAGDADRQALARAASGDAPRSELIWNPDRRPRWPGDWRTLGSGRFGSAERPVAWLRFEAPGRDVEALASQALDALAAIGGRVRLRDVAVDESGAAAVGHLRAQLITAAIDVAASEQSSVVSLTIETRPGLLEKPPAR